MARSAGAEVRSPPPHVGRRLVATVVLGTLLNPLNSSMIAVALGTLQRDFRVDLGTVSWLISGFYLAAAVGQPLMGRLADEFGPRRLFCAGLALVAVTGAVAPLAPSFGWLVVVRVVQAIGTSAGYPAGLALIRRAAGEREGRPPAGALGGVTVANSTSAALGPVLGGFLVAAAGWPAIFLVNVPVTVLGLVLALGLGWVPPDPPREPAGGLRALARGVDLPGVALFAGALVTLLGFLLSVSRGPVWALLPLSVLLTTLLLMRERRVSAPFLDVRMLGANRPLLGVYAQYAAVNVVFYGVFFGLPIWLEQSRGFGTEAAGLLLLPIAGLGALTTPLAARLITRSGTRPALVVGAVALTAGSLLLLGLAPATPVIAIVGVSVILGVPNGFNNLGLQAALYEDAPPAQTGAAAGLFQTARYLGAILATSLIGIVFSGGASSAGLHVLAGVIAAIAAGLVVVSVAGRRRNGRQGAGGPAGSA